MPAVVDGLAAYGTQAGRKTVMRVFFVTCAHLGLFSGDPSRDVKLVGSSQRRWRPLTDAEMSVVHTAAMVTGRVGRGPALLAVLRSGATVAETAFVEVRDVRLDERVMFLPGTGRATVPRWVPLTDWQVDALEFRLARLALRHRRDGDAFLSALVVMDGHALTRSVESCATGTQQRANDLLNRAGLFARDGYTPRSVRAWAAALAYAETRSVDAVAVWLGLSDLGRAAALAGADWHAVWECPAPPSVSGDRFVFPSHLSVTGGGDDDGP